MRVRRRETSIWRARGREGGREGDEVVWARRDAEKERRRVGVKGGREEE